MCLPEFPEIVLVAATGRADPIDPGGADVVVDVSAPSAALVWSALCAARRIPYIVGSTGLTEDAENQVRARGQQIPLLRATNFSQGVALLIDLAQRARQALPHFDAGIAELHHRHKKDAPSGTALSLAAALEASASSSVGIASLRGGDVVGEHTVFFLGSGERLDLRHCATDRAVFARGALTAARWIVTQPPGFYSMRDVLFRGG